MNCIEIKNVVKKFGDDIALDEINLNIQKGKIVAILGADGSGKTTLLRLIIGLLKVNDGEIVILGLNPDTKKEEIISKTGYMPQKFGLYEDLTVIENLNLYAKLKNCNENFDDLLDFTTLSPFKNRLAGNLSGGMKQKLAIACALLGKPKLLVLD